MLTAIYVLLEEKNNIEVITIVDMQKRTIPSGEIDEKTALQRAASLCSRQECCVSEVEEKLWRWGQSADAQERIISYLIKERYIDEARFCRAYSLDKMRYNHWGRVKISQALRQLGVPDRAREDALRELPQDEYADIVRRLAESKLPSIKAASDYECRGKLTRFLLGRGFELDIIQKICNFAPDND